MQFVLYIKGKEENAVKIKELHDREVHPNCCTVSDTDMLVVELSAICTVHEGLRGEHTQEQGTTRTGSTPELLYSE